ncbi:MAG: hypothetical protein ACK55Z_17130 [bacterium]
MPLRPLLHSERRGLCRPHGRLRRQALAADEECGTCVVPRFSSSSFRNAWAARKPILTPFCSQYLRNSSWSAESMVITVFFFLGFMVSRLVL